jgi:GDP-L-fucose synthase
MNINSKIFIAGHKGLVGSSVLDLLKKKGYKNLITVDRKELDLREYTKLKKFFRNIKIDYMIMAAARAGGILANSNNQKDFFLENIEIQNSLLKMTLDKNIKRTIFLGTSCIYPKFCKTPIKEESLLSGKLEKTNQCYAIAKIAGIKLCEALFENFKKDIICLMPTNVYGENDHFDKFNGHVIPAMITKFIEAKKKNKKKIILLGTGRPRREFIHSDDLAEAILFCLNLKRSKFNKIFKSNLPILNIGTKDELSINSLAKLIAKFVEYKGSIEFDSNYPDGTFKKNLDKTKINHLGWFPKIKFEEGLKEVIKSRTG